jgi:putative ABC transport system permease protein
MNLLKKLFQRPAVKQDIDDELRFHIEQRTAENIAAGMTAEEAAREGRKRFGNLQSVREECRELHGVSFGETAWRDIRFAIRQLRRNPGFTIVAVLTLALGIGANTAIFSVVNSVLLRPLPYREPGRLVRVYSEFPGFPNGGLRRFPISAPEYLELRRETKSWESLEAWASVGVNVGGQTQPTRARGSAVTGGLLRSLGVEPILGRLLTAEDDAPGAPDVVELSYGFWQSAFAGDAAILGREIEVNGSKATVVGVMPKDFQFPPGEIDPSELWAPLQIDPAHPGDPSEHSLNVLGRLRTGVNLSQAQAEIRYLGKRLAEAGSPHGFGGADHPVTSYGLHDEVVRSVRPALRMLLCAVGFLLLIACVNVANLLLARAESRQREIAIRSALGSGLGRLARQFVTEGLLLSSVGVGAGLLLAHVSLQLIRSAGAASLPRVVEIGIDARVVFFAASVALLTGVVFGLTPMAHVIKHDLQNALKSGGSSTGASAGIHRFRHGLVVGELALALTLLIGTGLMLRAVWNLEKVRAGVDPTNVVTMLVSLPDSNDRQKTRDFWTRLEGRLSGRPGVERMGLATGLPPIHPANHNDTKIEGFVPSPEQPVETVDFYQIVSKGYFDTMRIRLVEGRFFDERDSAESPETAVINQTMARAFWGNRSAVGGRIRAPGGTNWCMVVGVIADTKNNGLENPAGTEVFFPCPQTGQVGVAQQMYIAIRTAESQAAIVSSVRRVLSELDPSLPLTKIQTMQDVFSEAQSRPRFLALLLTMFAGVALTLAAVGIYGVISYSVAQRTKEFGLRLALGAQCGDVLGIVLGRSALLTLAGIGIGLIGAFALTRFLATLIFGVSTTDPVTFLVVSVVLGVVALLASYIPARRATKVDPMVALRHE